MDNNFSKSLKKVIIVSDDLVLNYLYKKNFPLDLNNNSIK